MKIHKHLLSLSVLGILLFAGCSRDDDGGLNDRIDDLVAQSEENANSIKILARAVQNAFEQNLTVNVNETADGWILEFSDGTTVTLPRGNKGDKGDDGDKGDKGDKGDAGKPFDVTLTTSDSGTYYIIQVGTETYTFNLTQSFFLNIDKEGLEFTAGQTLQVPYTISGDDGTVHLYIVDQSGFVCDIDEKSKMISITVPDPLPEDGYVVVSAVKNSTGEQSSRYIGLTAEGGTDGITFEVDVTYDAAAYSVYASMDFQLENIAEIGICWNEEGSPTIDDNVASISNPTKGNITICSITSGKKLKENTKYHVCAYAKSVDGNVSYAESAEFTTMASPLENWINSDTPADNKFNSLSEYGPSYDGSSDYNQYVTEAGCETQAVFRQTWDDALINYKPDYDFHYSYHNLMFREIDGQKYMYHQIFREGSPGEGQPKEANLIGGLLYSMTSADDGTMSFEFKGLQHVNSENWAYKNQDIWQYEMTTLYENAQNKSSVLAIQNFYEKHTFFVDYGPEITYGGNPYRELRFYATDDHSIVFNYHPRFRGYGDMDFTIHPVSEDPVESVDRPDYASSLTTVANFYNNESCAYAKVNWSEAGKTMASEAKSFTYEALLWANFSTDGTPVCDDWSKMPAGYSDGLYVLMGVEYGIQFRYWALTGFGFDYTTGLKNGNGVWMALVCDGGSDAVWNTTESVDDWTHQFDEGQYPNQTWYHWAVTYDYEAGVFNSYLDGKLIHTEEVGQCDLSILGKREDDSERDRGSFYIGYGYEPGKRCWPGCIMEARVWDRALSADEIGAEGHAVSVDPSTATGLIGYWKCNEGSGSTLYDYSGNGNHAEVVSATSILWQDVEEVGK